VFIKSLFIYISSYPFYFNCNFALACKLDCVGDKINYYLGKLALVEHKAG
jgi:hypothetical protein